MSSDWELREQGSEQWYENVVTGETSYDQPDSNYDFHAADTAATDGATSGYGADDGTAWEEDTTANFEWHGDETTGEWGETAHYDGAQQSGLYDFSKGYFGEDGMWYDDTTADDDEGKEAALTEEQEADNVEKTKKGKKKKKKKPNFEAPKMNFGWGKKAQEEEEAKRIADEEAAAAAADEDGDGDGDEQSYEAEDPETSALEPFADDHSQQGGHYAESVEWVAPDLEETTGFYDESGAWTDTVTATGFEDQASDDEAHQERGEDETGNYDEDTGEWVATATTVGGGGGGGEEAATTAFVDPGGAYGEDGEWYPDDTGEGRAGEETGYYDENTGTWYPEDDQEGQEWEDTNASTAGDEWMDAAGGEDTGYYDEDTGEWVDTINTVGGGGGDEGGGVGEETGYYDEETGEWVELGFDESSVEEEEFEEPNGYWDVVTGQWVEETQGGQEEEGGYYDEEGNWMEATAEQTLGYADEDGNVIDGQEWQGDGEQGDVDEWGYAEEGYYDDEGNWVNGALSPIAAGDEEELGYYNEDTGEWVEAEGEMDGGYYDENGEWVLSGGGGGDDDDDGSSHGGWYFDNVTGNWMEAGAHTLEDGDHGEQQQQQQQLATVHGGGGEAEDTSGSIVVTVLRASGLPPFRVKEAEDSYEKLVITDYLRKSAPFCVLSLASDSAGEEPRELGRTPAGVGANPDWVRGGKKPANAKGQGGQGGRGLPSGGVFGGESDPLCRMELFLPTVKASKDVFVEVWDECPDGPKLFYGRATVPRESVVQAMSFPYSDGGSGTTVTIDLKDRPLTLERTAKGNLTLRVDPQGAPPASGFSSDDEASLAALANFDGENMNLLEDMEESEKAAELAANASENDLASLALADADAKTSAEAAAAAALAAVLAVNAADEKGDGDGDGDNDEGGGSLSGAPGGGVPAASGKELKWPVSDVFVADAMANYLEVLDDAEFADKDRKKYDAFLREPKAWGQAGLREGSSAWQEREASTRAALRQALKDGKSVEEAERIVLQELGLWHQDAAKSDIAGIPLTTALVPGLEPLSPSSSGGGGGSGGRALSLAVQPFAPSLELPHVLDSPRTVQRKVRSANASLLGHEGALDANSGRFVSAAKVAKKKARLLALGLDPSDLTRFDETIDASSASSPASATTVVAGVGGRERKDSSLVVLDRLGVAVDATQVPGLTADACYPWQHFTKQDPDNPFKEVEYFYNVETKRTKLDKPREGYLWERKLEMLSQLTPRKVDPTSLERGLVDGGTGQPQQWQWRESDPEKRKRLQYLKAKDQLAKKVEKQRREAPTKREQVEAVMSLMLRAVEVRSARRVVRQAQLKRRHARREWHPASLGHSLQLLPCAAATEEQEQEQEQEQQQKLQQQQQQQKAAAALSPPPLSQSSTATDARRRKSSLFEANAAVAAELAAEAKGGTSKTKRRKSMQTTGQAPSEEEAFHEQQRLVSDLDLPSFVTNIDTMRGGERLPSNPGLLSRRPPGYQAPPPPPPPRTVLSYLASSSSSAQPHPAKRDAASVVDRTDAEDAKKKGNPSSSVAGWLKLPAVVPVLTSLVGKRNGQGGKSGLKKKGADKKHAKNGGGKEGSEDGEGGGDNAKLATKSTSTEAAPPASAASGSSSSNSSSSTTTTTTTTTTDFSGSKLDAATVTLELACRLPPRFVLLPNPMHEDNMKNPVAKALHQRRLRLKAEKLAREKKSHGAHSTPTPTKLWEQDEFNPTKLVYSTKPRDEFVASLVADVASSLGIPKEHVVVDELSCTLLPEAVDPTLKQGGAGCGAGGSSARAYEAPEDEEYSDDDEEEEDEDDDEKEGGSGDSDDDVNSKEDGDKEKEEDETGSSSHESTSESSSSGSSSSSSSSRSSSSPDSSSSGSGSGSSSSSSGSSSADSSASSSASSSSASNENGSSSGGDANDDLMSTLGSSPTTQQTNKKLPAHRPSVTFSLVDQQPSPPSPPTPSKAKTAFPHIGNRPSLSPSSRSSDGGGCGGNGFPADTATAAAAAAARKKKKQKRLRTHPVTDSEWEPWVALPSAPVLQALPWLVPDADQLLKKQQRLVTRQQPKRKRKKPNDDGSDGGGDGNSDDDNDEGGMEEDPQRRGKFVSTFGPPASVLLGGNGDGGGAGLNSGDGNLWALAMEETAAVSAAEEAATEARKLMLELDSVMKAYRSSKGRKAMPAVAEEGGEEGEERGQEEVNAHGGEADEKREGGEGNGLGGLASQRSFLLEGQSSARSDMSSQDGDDEEEEEGDADDANDDADSDNDGDGEDKKCVDASGQEDNDEGEGGGPSGNSNKEGRFTPRGTFLPPISPRSAALEAKTRKQQALGLKKLAARELKRQRVQRRHLKTQASEARELALKLAERALAAKVRRLLAETMEGERQELVQRLVSAQCNGPPPDLTAKLHLTPGGGSGGGAAGPGSLSGHTPSTAALAAAHAHPLGADPSVAQQASRTAHVVAAVAQVGVTQAALSALRLAHAVQHDVMGPLASFGYGTWPALVARDALVASRRKELSGDGRDRTVVRLTILGGHTRREGELSALVASGRAEQARAHGMLMGKWAAARAAVLDAEALVRSRIRKEEVRKKKKEQAAARAAAAKAKKDAKDAEDSDDSDDDSDDDDTNEEGGGVVLPSLGATTTQSINTGDGETTVTSTAQGDGGGDDEEGGEESEDEEEEEEEKKVELTPEEAEAKAAADAEAQRILSIPPPEPPPLVVASLPPPESALSRVHRLVNQVRVKEPLEVAHLRSKHRLSVRALILDRDQDLKAKVLEVTIKVQKRREARLGELGKRRRGQVLLSEKGGEEAAKEVEAKMQEGLASQLPKGMKAGRRLAEAKKTEAKRLEAALKAMRLAQEKESQRFKKQIYLETAKYNDERRQVLSRLMSKETSEKGVLTSRHGGLTSQLLDGLLEQQRLEMSSLRTSILAAQRSERTRAERKATLRRLAKAKAAAVKSARQQAAQQGKSKEQADRAAADAASAFDLRMARVRSAQTRGGGGGGGSGRGGYGGGGAAAVTGGDDDEAKGTGIEDGGGGLTDVHDDDDVEDVEGDNDGDDQDNGDEDNDEDDDDDFREAAVAEAGGARTVVDHPSQLARTSLLEGRVTCATLRCSGVVDRTGRTFPERWEGFWCHIISPVYFGRKSGGRVAGMTQTRKQHKRLSTARGRPLVRDPATKSLMLGLPTKRNQTAPAKLAILKSVAALAIVVPHPSSSPPASPQLRPPPPTAQHKGQSLGKKKSSQRLKPPPNRPLDAADLAREADKRYEVSVGGKSGGGLVLGFESGGGHLHMTPEQHRALLHKERAHLNLKASDARAKRKLAKWNAAQAAASGGGGGGSGAGGQQGQGQMGEHWYSRPRKQPHRFTKREVGAMVEGNDKEAVRARRSRMRALQDAKAKRQIDGERKKKRAAMEAWMIGKLMAIDAEPELFKEAMEEESKREQDEQRGGGAAVALSAGAGGGSSQQQRKAKEVSGAAMAAAAEDLRMKRREKDSHEHKAKELFRDMRRLFEKTMKDTHLPTGELRSAVIQGDDGEKEDKHSDGDAGGKSGRRSSSRSSSRQKERQGPGGGGGEKGQPLLHKRAVLTLLQGSPASGGNGGGGTEHHHHHHHQPGAAAAAAGAGAAASGQVKGFSSEWAQRANLLKGLRPLCEGQQAFISTFLLSPVEARAGFVTVDEFALYAHGVHEVVDRYGRVRLRLDALAKRKEEEKNKFKLLAERRRIEELAKAQIFEAKRREAVLALQQKIMASRLDPHAADDAWKKFHVHMVVKPVKGHPAYCCTCRRRKWEKKRDERLEGEAAWRQEWADLLEAKLRRLRPALERRAKRILAYPHEFEAAQKPKPRRLQVFECVSALLASVEKKVAADEKAQVAAQVARALSEVVDAVTIKESRAELAGLAEERGKVKRELELRTMHRRRHRRRRQLQEQQELQEQGTGGVVAGADDAACADEDGVLDEDEDAEESSSSDKEEEEEEEGQNVAVDREEEGRGAAAAAAAAFGGEEETAQQVSSRAELLLSLRDLDGLILVLKRGLGLAPPAPPPPPEEVSRVKAQEKEKAANARWEEMACGRCDLTLSLRANYTLGVTATTTVPARLLLEAPDDFECFGQGSSSRRSKRERKEEFKRRALVAEALARAEEAAKVKQQNDPAHKLLNKLWLKSAAEVEAKEAEARVEAAAAKEAERVARLEEEERRARLGWADRVEFEAEETGGWEGGGKRLRLRWEPSNELLFQKKEGGGEGEGSEDDNDDDDDEKEGEEEGEEEEERDEYESCVSGNKDHGDASPPSSAANSVYPTAVADETAYYTHQHQQERLERKKRYRKLQSLKNKHEDKVKRNAKRPRVKPFADAWVEVELSCVARDEGTSLPTKWRLKVLSGHGGEWWRALPAPSSPAAASAADSSAGESHSASGDGDSGAAVAAPSQDEEGLTEEEDLEPDDADVGEVNVTGATLEVFFQGELVAKDEWMQLEDEDEEKSRRGGGSGAASKPKKGGNKSMSLRRQSMLIKQAKTVPAATAVPAAVPLRGRRWGLPRPRKYSNNAAAAVRKTEKTKTTKLVGGVLELAYHSMAQDLPAVAKKRMQLVAALKKQKKEAALLPPRAAAASDSPYGSGGGGGGGVGLNRRSKVELKQLFKSAVATVAHSSGSTRKAEERYFQTVGNETLRRGLQLEREEEERKGLAREEERGLRVEEATRRLVERKDRTFQEVGHRLYQQTVGALARCPGKVRRLQWVKALQHGGAGGSSVGGSESVLACCRDPADGNMYLCRFLVCQYDEDVDFALEQLRVHEDELSNCPFVMRLFGASSAFCVPVVSNNTGLLQARVRVVVSVLSFCPGGNVADYCGNGSGGSSGGLDNDSAVRWAKDCAAGLRALHAKGLTHRNLNPKNVHLDARGRAVLTGFQVLKNPRAPGDLYSLGRADCGSYNVVSPEVDEGHPVSPAADVWALGCCLLAWVSGDVEGGSSLARVRERSLEEILRRVPRRFGPKIRSALRMALQHHPEHRASAADLWKLLSTSHN